MGKRKLPEETFTAFLGDTQKTDKRQTSEVQAADVQQTSEVLQRYNVRLHEKDWKGLRRAAAAEGTSASAIIRRLVKEYLRGH
jgi:predicted DNA binding CopG/RHH family protein